MTDVDPLEWKYPAGLVLKNSDTTTLREVGFFLRSNDRFTDDTLTLGLTIYTPDTLRYEESVRLVVPRTVIPSALVRETAIPYRSRVKFPRTGDYRVILTPARPVTGIEAIGIHIEKSN